MPRAATPIVAFTLDHASAASSAIRNPANRDDVVGTVVEATANDVVRAVATAVEAGRAWSDTAPAARAACLERAADLLEAERATFLALAMREAGKTLANAVAEVREATDFLRYYAAQARTELAAPGVTAIGPVVAISPWNFPLAIFVGEVAAALAAGNPVLAKPAEQTPLIAYEAVRLLHRAGVPGAALQLLPGRGEIVGAALVADPRVAGVIFTGSTDVARGIARELARRDDDPVLIAETGGQNAMIVDSSALAEQVVTDALASAFDSAGQRCSALRVLCVQEDVAPGDARDARRRDARARGRRSAAARGRRRSGDRRRRARRARRARGAHAFGRVARGRARAAARMRATARSSRPRSSISAASAGSRISRAKCSAPCCTWCAGSAASSARSSTRSTRPATASRTASTRASTRRSRRSSRGSRPATSTSTATSWARSSACSRSAGTGSPARDRRPAARSTCGGSRGTRPLRCRPRPIALPGPTGETNTLEFHPRGVVLCIARDERTLVAQAKAALALGNTVLHAPRADRARGARPSRRPAEVVLTDTLDPAAIDAVLLDVSADRARRVRTELAATDGPIVPVVVWSATARCDWSRLVVERTVTVNTAAAGGNAALLSLSEDAA